MWLFGKKRKKKVVGYGPYFAFDIYMRPGAIETIRMAKGIKSDSELAEDLQVTRQYVSNLRHRRATVTATVIVRLAVLMGNIQRNWWIYFEILPTHKQKTPNSMELNYEKHRGQLPYSKYSPDGNFRKLDGKVEFSDAINQLELF